MCSSRSRVLSRLASGKPRFHGITLVGRVVVRPADAGAISLGHSHLARGPGHAGPGKNFMLLASEDGNLERQQRQQRAVGLVDTRPHCLPRLRSL